MNGREHGLMIGMLARQASLIKTLVEILETRGVLDYPDVKAFTLYANQDPVEQEVMFEQMTRYYVEAARRIGLVVQISGLKK
jgi:hypothetical protein